MKKIVCFFLFTAFCSSTTIASAHAIVGDRIRTVRSITSELHKTLDDLSRESGIKETVAELHNEVNGITQKTDDKLLK
jgi:hypothetical protein